MNRTGPTGPVPAVYAFCQQQTDLSHFYMIENGADLLLCAFEARPGVDMIVMFPGNDMNVKVGHRLPRAFAAGVEEIDPFVSAVGGQVR